MTNVTNHPKRPSKMTASSEDATTRQVAPPTLGAWSLKGPVRKENQERVQVAWVAGVAVVVMADGLGGMPLGGEAADAAVKHAFKRLRKELAEALRAGHEGVRTLLLSVIWSAATNLAVLGHERGVRKAADGLCTTLILVVALAESYVVAWIGDGGAFVLRGKAAVDRLLDPHKSPDAPTLLEAFLGPESDGTPSWKVSPRRPGDVLLVATDGVADRLDGPVVTRLHTALGRSGSAKAAARDFLGALARQKNPFGRFVFTDNLTVALLLTDGTPVVDTTEQGQGAVLAQPTTQARLRPKGQAAAAYGPSTVRARARAG